MSDENITTARDVAQGVKALQVGVDALGMIAGLGGVQGDWALDALREINHLVVGDEPTLRLVENDDPHLRGMIAVQRGRRLAGMEPNPKIEAALRDRGINPEPVTVDRCVCAGDHCAGHIYLDHTLFDAALGEGRR